MYIVFDIGGTKTRIAKSVDLKSFTKPIIFPTPKKFEAGMVMFDSTIRQLAKGEKIIAMAGGIAGVFDQGKTKLVTAPNLPYWKNKPLKKSLEKISNSKVFLENDSALVGLGEAIAGAGKGKNIVAYLTISTGIGGVKIVNQKINKRNMGFEPGHQIICQSEDKKYTYLEKVASGAAITKKYHRLPFEIKSEKFWRKISSYVAYGVHNTIVFWSPDIVILGGGMIKKPGIIIETVQQQVAKTLTKFTTIPKIKKAKLKDIGGLYGAMHFLKDQL